MRNCRPFQLWRVVVVVGVGPETRPLSRIVVVVVVGVAVVVVGVAVVVVALGP